MKGGLSYIMRYGHLSILMAHISQYIATEFMWASYSSLCGHHTLCERFKEEALPT